MNLIFSLKFQQCQISSYTNLAFLHILYTHQSFLLQLLIQIHMHIYNHQWKILKIDLKETNYQHNHNYYIV